MKDFLVVRRIFNEADEVEEVEPELTIKNVPQGISSRQLKLLLEQTGQEYQWGLYTIVDKDDWVKLGDLSEAPDHIETRLIILQRIEELDYEELLDRVNNEKRITLRLPVGLHVALSRSTGGMTLNSYCIRVLADAVGYSRKLEEFEKKRNKPGRPKKVQDGE